MNWMTALQLARISNRLGEKSSHVEYTNLQWMSENCTLCSSETMNAIFWKKFSPLLLLNITTQWFSSHLRTTLPSSKTLFTILSYLYPSTIIIRNSIITATTSLLYRKLKNQTYWPTGGCTIHHHVGSVFSLSLQWRSTYWLICINSTFFLNHRSHLVKVWVVKK